MTRWIHSGGEPVIDFLSVLAVVAVAAFAMGGALAGLVLLLQRIDPPDEPGSDADDRGGGNVRPDPRRPSGGGDPAWWPEFEREFANYVASADAAESRGANGPAHARAQRHPAYVPSRSPRRRTGDRHALRPRRRRHRGRPDACLFKRPR